MTSAAARSVGAGLFLLVVACRASAPAPDAGSSPAAARPSRCEDCHADIVARVARSHHGQGQRAGSPAFLPRGSLAGGFHWDDAGVFTWPGDDAASGTVTSVLGVDPLVQLAVTLPDGRVQVPDVAWDTRDGGWFLVPHLEGPAGHWLGETFSWSASCAPCHATRFRVGADSDGRSAKAASAWQALSVGCEACHGSARGHDAWLARGGPDAGYTPGAAGFEWTLAEAAVPDFSDGGPVATLHAPADLQVELCAACHSQRRALADDGRVTANLLDAYEPLLLARGRFFPDGQVRDEVYEVPSFAMSRMHTAGVRCTHCHEPHDGTLRAPGNTLCASCHRADVFDVRAHHGHRPGTPAASCLTCHMPPTTFMGRDVRRDHLFPVPAPLVSARTGSPDVCTGCHHTMTPARAAAAIATWAPRRARREVVADAFAAAFAERADARSRLLQVAQSEDLSAFTRASALALLAESPGPGVGDAVHAAASSPDAVRRYAAALAYLAMGAEERGALASQLVRDERLAVRVAMARALPDLSEAALAEAETAERANALRGDSWLNRGAMQLALGSTKEAERLWRQGLALRPSFAPLAINLADLLQATGRDAEGGRVLETVRGVAPWESDVEHAYGLWLLRNGRREEAVAALERASSGGPKWAWTWLVGVRDVRGTAAGWKAFEVVKKRWPGNAEVLLLGALWARDERRPAVARRLIREVLVLDPQHAAARRLEAELGP